MSDVRNTWTQIWTDLPSEAAMEFSRVQIEYEFKRGDSVYRQGDPARGIYFVHSGLVGLMVLGQSGKEHLMRFFSPGQFFGHRALFGTDGYHGTAVVLEQTQLILLPAESVQAVFKKHPSLIRPFVEVLARELRHCETHQVAILEQEILPRVSRALIYLKDLKPQHNWTRNEIAQFCASTAPTVIKALAQLESIGAIKQDGREIMILNREHLLELSDQ